MPHRASTRSRARRRTSSRDEDAIDHDWGEGSPGAGISANRFVARWTRTLSLAPGEYEFAVTADDGVRLYVDGVRVIDKWIDQGPTTYRTTLPLDGGPHTIVMEYYENGGGATARLDYTRSATPAEHAVSRRSTGTRRTPAGAPTIPTRPADLERDDDTLDFDWGDGSPGTGIARGPVRGALDEDGEALGRRLPVQRCPRRRDPGLHRQRAGGRPVDTPATPSTASTRSCPAAHTSCVSSTSRQAAARAPSSPTTGSARSCRPTAGYAAEYFANRDLAGAPVLTRTDDAVDFDWGGGTPGDGVPADNFSARWTKSVTLDEAGAYKFTVTGDDGVRLYIDGEKVLDKWIHQAPTTYTVIRQLAAGTHEIVLEYFEAGGRRRREARLRGRPTAAAATSAG